MFMAEKVKLAYIYLFVMIIKIHNHMRLLGNIRYNLIDWELKISHAV